MATLYYEVGFATNQAALKMTGTTATFAFTIATGTWAHQTMASSTDAATAGYTAFAAQLKTQMDAAGGGPYTVTYSNTTHFYTISRSTTFTFDLSGGTSAAYLAAALGMTATSHSGASSYTSTVRPYYVIVPSELARSLSLPFVYEPADITEEAVSDGGTPYSVAKNTTELWSDWTQFGEAKAACFTTYATAAVPWTWQALFKHARGERPIAVYESALSNFACKLRAKGASFAVKPVTPDWDAIFNVALQTRFLGTL